MFKVLVLLAVLALVAAQRHPDYDKFLKKHGKKTAHLTEEVKKRREENFFANKASFERINSKNLGYKVGTNKHSDRDRDRFLQERCRLQLPAEVRSLPVAPQVTTTIKSSVNYTSLGQPVLNQGTCGSCWAFASVAVVEMNQAFKNLPPVTLSPQHLVDCDTFDNGCNGGWPRNTFEFIRNNLAKKVANLADYAYTSGPTNVPGTCKTTGFNTASVDITSTYQDNLDGDETKLMARISNNGPAAIAMFVPSGVGFFGYKSGIYYDPTCPVATATASQCSQVNHAMVVVGYGKDASGSEYWIVRNSWGTSWGENGYMRIAKNRGNNCNIACFAMGIV